MNVNGFMDLPSWANGLVVLPWWGYLLVALLATHITIAAVTIYLHRHSAHRALTSTLLWRISFASGSG